jgi:hypothetical protein
LFSLSIKSSICRVFCRRRFLSVRPEVTGERFGASSLGSDLRWLSLLRSGERMTPEPMTL